MTGVARPVIDAGTLPYCTQGETSVTSTVMPSSLGRLVTEQCHSRPSSTLGFQTLGNARRGNSRLPVPGDCGCTKVEKTSVSSLNQLGLHVVIQLVLRSAAVDLQGRVAASRCMLCHAVLLCDTAIWLGQATALHTSIKFMNSTCLTQLLLLVQRQRCLPARALQADSRICCQHAVCHLCAELQWEAESSGGGQVRRLECLRHAGASIQCAHWGRAVCESGQAWNISLCHTRRSAP